MVEVGRTSAMGLQAFQKHARGNAVGEDNVHDTSGLCIPTMHGQRDGDGTLSTDQKHSVAKALLDVMFVCAHNRGVSLGQFKPSKRGKVAAGRRAGLVA